jgi:hypothetical protein
MKLKVHRGFEVTEEDVEEGTEVVLVHEIIDPQTIVSLSHPNAGDACGPGVLLPDDLVRLLKSMEWQRMSLASAIQRIEHVLRQGNFSDGSINVKRYVEQHDFVDLTIQRGRVVHSWSLIRFFCWDKKRKL